MNGEERLGWYFAQEQDDLNMCILHMFKAFFFCLMRPTSSKWCRNDQWRAKSLIRWSGCKGWSGPEVIEVFSCSTHLSRKFVLLINLKLLIIPNFFLLNIAEHEISSGNKYENANNSWIFIFISRENFMLSWVEHEKSFITSGPECTQDWGDVFAWYT